jgi:beta-glucuronidase
MDLNRNGQRDEAEAVTGDFKMMQEMGCNTIRVLNTIPFDKELLRDLHKTYGIRVLICDPFGAYTVHSGARWEIGTDYTDRVQRKNMKEAALKTAEEFGKEPWLLGYILGNENNMSADYTGVNASRTMASSQPKDYALFLNEVAGEIRKADPDHIIGVGNMELGLADQYALYAPEIDFVGVNSYPGVNGFGALWIRAKRIIDRPIIITEFGCDAYATSKGVDEESQSEWLKNGWEDIVYNAAGGPGEGNAIGGLVFEWLDEWWKDTRGDPYDRQNTEPTIEFAFPDGFSQEEWLGIMGQGDGAKSPFLRVPRKAYFTMKGLWTTHGLNPKP